LIAKFIKTLFRGEPQAPRAVTNGARHHYITNTWHAVSTVPGPRACAAARKSVGARFLSKDAPVFPLPDCDSRLCTCHFRHHTDRRHALRRTADVMASSGPHWIAHERRNSQGRRVND
jgi:hypothetical protein